MKVSFDQMPSNARTWVYTANRILSPVESAQLLTRLDPFLSEWSSHGTPLKAACQVFDNAVVVIAVENGWETASGCSIDKSVRVLKELEQELNISLFDRMIVLFRNAPHSDLQLLPLAQFKNKMADGEVMPSVLIVNTQVEVLGELKEDLWKPVKDSWLSRFLPSTTV
jgi:hypothetical protein